VTQGPLRLPAGVAGRLAVQLQLARADGQRMHPFHGAHEAVWTHALARAPEAVWGAPSCNHARQCGGGAHGIWMLVTIVGADGAGMAGKLAGAGMAGKLDGFSPLHSCLGAPRPQPERWDGSQDGRAHARGHPVTQGNRACSMSQRLNIAVTEIWHANRQCFFHNGSFRRTTAWENGSFDGRRL